MKPKKIYLTVDEYKFKEGVNQYAYNAEPKLSLSSTAQAIDEKLLAEIDLKNSLIRGVQSSKRKTSYHRNQLVDFIATQGTDVVGDANNTGDTIYALEYDKGTVKKILQGFHEFKPKCLEKPPSIVDIWLVFDKLLFKNISYQHPIYKITVNDKWELKNESTRPLKAILIIN